MPNSLLLILSETRFPSQQPAHSGGVEAACASGLIKDGVALRSFLRGRLWTTGSLGAHAAAGVCARAGRPPVHQSLWRTVEAELDARILSPAARQASRGQGGEVLRLALTVSYYPLLDSLARATISTDQQPHHAVALGAVAAAAGVTPADAALSAAYASVAGPAFAAQQILDLSPAVIAEIGVEMAPEIERLASSAASAAWSPFSDLPSFGAPALEYLAEEHAARADCSFAS